MCFISKIQVKMLGKMVIACHFIPVKAETEGSRGSRSCSLPILTGMFQGNDKISKKQGGWVISWEMIANGYLWPTCAHMCIFTPKYSLRYTHFCKQKPQWPNRISWPVKMKNDSSVWNLFCYIPPDTCKIILLYYKNFRFVYQMPNISKKASFLGYLMKSLPNSILNTLLMNMNSIKYFPYPAPL